MKSVYEQKSKAIIALCMALIIASLNLCITKEVKGAESYNLEYTAVNIKDISAAKVSVKEGKKDDSVVSEIEKVTNLTLTNRNNSDTGKIQPVSLPTIEHNNNNNQTVEPISNGPTWRLPVEIGTITTWPQYNHVALDITSWRGTGETIYPVADGVITGIYYDNYGALCIMVNHNINGVNYTSQYVHMSSFAPGIYVGMPVNTNTPLGQMGSTGFSTGNHLHISVVDCNYGDPNDPNCPDLGGFFRYLKIRYQQGFQGLNSVIDVPWTWSSR